MFGCLVVRKGLVDGVGVDEWYYGSEEGEDDRERSDEHAGR